MSSDFKNIFKGEMINLNPLGLGSPPIYNGAYSFMGVECVRDS